MTDDAPRYAGLGDYLRLLRKQWLLIVLPAIIGGVVTYALANRAAPSYQANSAVSIQDDTQELELLGTSVAPGSAPGTAPEVVAETGNTPRLARAVQRKLGTPLSIAEIQGSLSMAVDPNSGLLDITTTASSGILAQRLANAFARQIAAETTATARREFGAAIGSLVRRMNHLSGNDPTTIGERADIQGEISRLDFLQANATPGQVAQLAQGPGAQVSPTPGKDALLGILAGLLLGIVLAFVRESFDHRLRGSAAISSELGWPLLGHVRSQAMGLAVQPSSVRHEDRAGDVESFRIMRRNLDSLAPDVARGAILITSALPEEGKSTVAASLALAAAVTGRRTLLIEADLRRPSLARRLGVSARPGLAEYLSGKAEPQEILQTIAVPAPGSTSNGHDPAGSHANGNGNGNGTADLLVCIAAGSPTTGAAEMLASPRMQALMREVTQVYDLVIVDSAPLLPVADTLELLGIADGVVLCVRSGRTTREQVRAAKAAVDAHSSGRSNGIVVTDLHPGDDPSGSGLYPYLYGQGERAGVS
jgi:polysaccharide biosynthesis transport protein